MYDDDGCGNVGARRRTVGGHDAPAQVGAKTHEDQQLSKRLHDLDLHVCLFIKTRGGAFG